MKKYSKTALWVVSISILLLLRIYKLDEIGLFDYDSARNYEKALSFFNGDFSDLFHHAAPLPNLIYGLLSIVSDNTFLFYLFNALINIVSIYLLVRTFEWRYPLLLFLLLGTSFLMVSSSRYVSIEALSLFFFAAWLYTYLTKLREKSNKYAAVWLSLLLLCNYKAVVIVFFVFCWEVYQYLRNLKSQQKSDFWSNIFFFTIPLVVMLLIGLLLGLPIYQYPATLFQILWQPSFIQSGSNDYLFYFKYIIDLEFPVVFLAIPLVFLLPLSNIRTKYLGFTSVVYFVLMCLLPKAPRGIIFLLPLMYILVYYLLERWVKNFWALLAIIVLGASLQVYRLNKYIYPYEKADFQSLDDFLVKEQIDHIGCWYFSKPYHLQAAVIRVTEKEKRPKYVLVDCFSEVVKLPAFKDDGYQLLWEGENRHLLVPMIFLENAEYTRRSYEECWASQKKMLRSSCHLRLYKRNDL